MREKLHVVFIKKDGYTQFRTSDNRTGSEPCGVAQTIVKLLKAYKHFTLEIL